MNVKPAFHKKQYLDFTKIEFELYNLIDLFNDRYITNREFYHTFLNEIHPFLDGNGRTCKKYYLKINFNSLSNAFCQILVFLLILERIVSEVDCIVNNGNILTDGRWKCYHHSNKRVCWRE